MWTAAFGAGVPLAAVGIAAWAAMHPAAQIYGPVVRCLPEKSGKRTLAITFDDGPNPAATPELLRILERHGARATFFLIGKYVRESPALVREIAARGHVIANHTDTHPSLIWLSRAGIRTELERCADSLTSALGAPPSRWMRPPYGQRGPLLNGVVRAMGFDGVVTWSVICYDWKPQPPERLIRRLGRVRAGDIVVLHDGDSRVPNGDRRHVLAALEHWLPRWRDAGIEFVTMDDVPRDAAH